MQNEGRNPTPEQKIVWAGNKLRDACYGDSASRGWWEGLDPKTNPLVVPLKLALVHSEISEALEGDRKQLMDDKLPHRPMLEVELADAVIRIMDLCGALRLDIGGAIAEKMAYNAQRADHKPENRAAAGGKRY